MSPTASDHARRVLAAVLPARRDLLEVALRRLQPAHFPDLTLANVFTMLQRYLEVTGGVLTESALSDILGSSGADPGKVLQYIETFRALVLHQVSEPDFLWSVEQLLELSAQRATTEAVMQGMEILTKGAEDEKGNRLFGHEDARAHVIARFAEIEREASAEDAPEGNMRAEGSEMLQNYADRKALHASGKSGGLEFGIHALDRRTAGLQPGELDLLIGYTSSGKTSLGIQLCWNVMVNQGLNVVIATTETLREQVRRKILSRHSKLPKFGLQDGINSADLKNGTLSPEHELVLKDVIADFTHNPDYGQLQIIQVPRGGTIGVVESRTARVNRGWPVHLLFMDYLQLLNAERRRADDRQEQSRTVKDAKGLATTFDKGRGLVLVSPWQVNRAGRDNALKEGGYTLNATSETAESSNTADVAISLLDPADKPSRYVDVRAQILKNRDGETMAPIELRADYATSTFTEKNNDGGMDGLI